MRHTVYHKILDSTLTLPTSSLRLKDEDPRLTAKFLHPWERRSDKNYAVWQPNYWGWGVWGGVGGNLQSSLLSFQKVLIERTELGTRMAFSVAQHFEKNNYQDLNLLFFFCQGGVCIENESKYCRREKRRQFIFGWLAAELHSSGRCQDWNGWELQHRGLFAAVRTFNQSPCYLWVVLPARM